MKTRMTGMTSFTAPCLPLTPKSQALPSLAPSVYDVWSSTRLPFVLEQFMQKAENGEESMLCKITWTRWP